MASPANTPIETTRSVIEVKRGNPYRLPRKHNDRHPTLGPIKTHLKTKQSKTNHDVPLSLLDKNKIRDNQGAEGQEQPFPQIHSPSGPTTTTHNQSGNSCAKPSLGCLQLTASVTTTHNQSGNSCAKPSLGSCN